MTRGRKVTGRPYPACPSLKEKRWNTHTDLPSVNRVCKQGREGQEGEPVQRAGFVFVQLVLVPPAGVFVSALCLTKTLRFDSRLNKTISILLVMHVGAAPKQVASSSFSQRCASEQLSQMSPPLFHPSCAVNGSVNNMSLSPWG